jgi:hypothetical protein
MESKYSCRYYQKENVLGKRTLSGRRTVWLGELFVRPQHRKVEENRTKKKKRKFVAHKVNIIDHGNMSDLYELSGRKGTYISYFMMSAQHWFPVPFPKN